MAELTTVGLILSPIIEIIANKAYSYIENQYKWKRDMPKNFKRLADILTEIKVVVAVPEHLQSMDASQKQLLRQLKDAINEADNLLDEFEYRIKEAQAVEDGGKVSLLPSPVTSAIRLIGQDKLANKLKEILDELDYVRRTFCDLPVGSERNNAIQQSNIVHDRVTSSILPTSEAFGRAKEKEEVINLLLKIVDKPESSRTNVPVIAIVGDGGIGKTTLARLVYDDQRIKNQFDMMMWICVSENFDMIRLTMEILECISVSNERNKDVMNFNHLQKELQTKILSKRFLLVLDDVWTKENNKASSNQVFFNQEMWEILLAPLMEGKRGSKILVTTRMEIVASVFDATLYPLRGLPDNETWSILKKYAFGNEIPYNSSELEVIGQQIIKRLNGSPLATRVVASMLKDKSDARSWLEILERRIFNDVISVLELSYQHLPDHLKYCFAYCSIFPKDWKFEPKKLVLLWIAQGYVLPDETERSLRDIGMDYFNQLLSRSLFERVEQHFDTHYVMHYLIHDLAQYVSKDECFRIDGGKQENIIETIRHLGVVINCADELKDILTRLEKMSNLKNLRTLILFGYARWNHGDLGILKELKNLRVLDFGESLVLRFPEALCHCLHLRYLNLGQHFSGILPNSLSRLYHLQVLSASQLPLSQSMFRLLKFGEPKFLAVKRLKFKVERERCHRIGVLKDMGMEMVVQGDLCIMNLQNVTDKAEAAEADLGSKQYLDGLELHWDSSSALDGLKLPWDSSALDGLKLPWDLHWDSSSTSSTRINGHDADQGVAEALKPHPNLKSLTIQGFRGRRCPRWLESKWLDNLQSLSLIDCSELEVLPPLDHLPFLKKYTVKECPKLISFPRFPPMLWEIEIRETGSISELSLRPSSSPECFGLGTSGISSHTALLHDHHLRAIQELRLDHCKEPLPVKWLLRLTTLKKLKIYCCQQWVIYEEEDGGSRLPSSLESLEISYCPVTERWLFRCLQGLISLKELIINNCPELKSLQQEDGGGVLAQSLEFLSVKDCPVTERWLFRCLQGLISLKELIVDNCPELKSLPQEDGGGVLAPSLELLSIRDCPVTDLSLISHCTSLKKLIIENCSELKSLPQKHGGSIHAPSLELLKIRDCPVTVLSLISHCRSLKELMIENCPELKSLPQENGDGVLATSLESLEIWRCPVTDLSFIYHFTSLKSLTTEDCPELKSLPEEGLPTSLQEVGFVGCGVPKESVVRCLQGLPSLSKLTLDFQIDSTALTSVRHLTVTPCGCEDPRRRLICAMESIRLVSDSFEYQRVSSSALTPRRRHLLAGSCSHKSFRHSGSGVVGTSKEYPPVRLSALTPRRPLLLARSFSHESFRHSDSGVVGTSKLELLTSLSELSIRSCDKPTYLHRLSALRKLHILYCNKLTSLRGLEELFNPSKYDELAPLRDLHASLPSSIKYLYLYKCPPALEQQIREKKGSEWHMFAHIPYIYIE